MQRQLQSATETAIPSATPSATPTPQQTVTAAAQATVIAQALVATLTALPPSQTPTATETVIPSATPSATSTPQTGATLAFQSTLIARAIVATQTALPAMRLEKANPTNGATAMSPLAGVFFPYVRNILAASLLGITLLTTIFLFVLRWGHYQYDEGTIHRAFRFLGYVFFLLAGVMVGLLAFPILAPPWLSDLPTMITTVGALLLLTILALRSATAGLEGTWELVHSFLNFAIGLLLMLFFLMVAIQLAGFVI